MPLFFLLAAGLVIVVLMLLLPSLARRQQSTAGVDRRAVNISIARGQLDELKQKFTDGELPNEEFQAERLRLEKDLAVDITATETRSRSSDSSWMVWTVAAVIPVIAGVVYLFVGTPAAIDPANRVVAVANQEGQQTAAQMQNGQATPDLREVVGRIKERLAEQPEDVMGWFMLGRAHMALGEYASAVTAIRKSLELGNENPDVMIRLADALAMNQGGSMAGEPEPLLVRALELQPDHPQGLWLLGIAQSERGDNAAAISTWQTLMPLLQGDQKAQQEVSQLIAQAQQAGTGDNAGSANVDPSPAAESSSSAGSRLVVEVALMDGVAADLPPESTVFVYAKAAVGPPMPLAVARKSLGELPFTVILTDEDAMMPEMKLSAFDQLTVGARISLDGNAIARAGDIFGEVSNITADGTEPVRVQITTVKQ